MLSFIENLIGLRQITVEENQRAIVLRDGRFMDILRPGKHWVTGRKLRVDCHTLSTGRLISTLQEALLRARPDLAAAHLTEVATGANEVAVVSLQGRTTRIVGPEAKIVLWTDAGPWTVERIDTEASLTVAPALAARLARIDASSVVATTDVPQGYVGLLTVDGVQAEVLQPGLHRHWTVGHRVAVRLIDTRWRSHDVTGQEVLTADRVSLRVNLAADYRVTDPLVAAGAVKDFEEALHRALQFAFRKSLGAKTLDAILAEKVSVDAQAAEAVRAEMAAIGVEVGEIALKDVILPGEMREILNRVVAAQKEAEANVIRRREETNATRSLLNTAKVMAENPVMLRLKELEALESISARVDQLTIHNGTAGLLDDIARLRD